MEQIDLAALVREVVMDVKITAARRGIQVGRRSSRSTRCSVLGDRAMLHRAFLNVVTNAVKFSHDDGSDPRRRAHRPRAQVEVEIADNGIGIPAAEIDRLGTRFFRASNAVTNEIAGTGLGVRIMQTIVDKHAGGVVIESEEGIGTTVIVRLPMHVATAEVSAADDPAAAGTARSSRRAGRGVRARARARAAADDRAPRACCRARAGSRTAILRLASTTPPPRVVSAAEPTPV